MIFNNISATLYLPMFVWFLELSFLECCYSCFYQILHRRFAKNILIQNSLILRFIQSSFSVLSVKSLSMVNVMSLVLLHINKLSATTTKNHTLSTQNYQNIDIRLKYWNDCVSLYFLDPIKVFSSSHSYTIKKHLLKVEDLYFVSLFQKNDFFNNYPTEFKK